LLTGKIYGWGNIRLIAMFLVSLLLMSCSPRESRWKKQMQVQSEKKQTECDSMWLRISDMATAHRADESWLRTYTEGVSRPVYTLDIQNALLGPNKRSVAPAQILDISRSDGTINIFAYTDLSPPIYYKLKCAKQSVSTTLLNLEHDILEDLFLLVFEPDSITPSPFLLNAEEPDWAEPEFADSVQLSNMLRVEGTCVHVERLGPFAYELLDLIPDEDEPATQ
jgi:hypothetical protein